MSIFVILILSLPIVIINCVLQTHITTDTNSNKYGKVILVEDTRDPPLNNDSNGVWYLNCNPEMAAFWGLQIELKSDLYGFKKNNDSIVEIRVNDVERDVELDLLTAFSVNDKYFANFNNIDLGYGWGFPDGSGQYIYPKCSSNLATNNDLEHVFSNIDNVTTITRLLLYEHALIASGNVTDLYKVSNSKNTNGSSVRYKIRNDGINDKVYFEFNSGGVNYQCMYNDSFDADHDLYFYIQNDCDSQREESWVHSFDIITRYIFFYTN